MQHPEHLKYTPEHEWVDVDASSARVGITDYAQDALGDVVFVQLPDVGSSVESGARCAEVESTKAVSEIYAPVSGTVTGVNAALTDEPERLNRDPYASGWILTIEMREPAELETLLDAPAYLRLIEGA